MQSVAVNLNGWMMIFTEEQRNPDVPSEVRLANDSCWVVFYLSVH